MRRVSGIARGAVRRARARVRPRLDEDRGAIALLVAVSMMILIGLAALVVDRGLAADSQRQAQSAADASALAAAVELTRGGNVATADASARAYALANYRVAAGDWAGCTAPLQPGYVAMTGTTCISHNPATRAVRVTLPTRQIPSAFGGIFGVSRRTVVSSAAAGYGAPPTAGCVLCVLGDIAGQVGQIEASGGDVYARNITFNGGPNGFITVSGGRVTYSGTATVGNHYAPPPAVQVRPLADPFGAIPQPAVDPARVAIAGAGRCSPTNYYHSISGCTAFDPGVYVLVGDQDHQANVSATDVMFFLTCYTRSGSGNSVQFRAHLCDSVNGEAGANFGGAGNSSVQIEGLRSDPVYRGFAVWVDRNNTTGQKWTGNADFTVRGTSYSQNPAGVDSTRGNGKITVINGSMVVGRVDMRGNHLHFDVRGTPVPGTSIPPTIPRLTE